MKQSKKDEPDAKDDCEIILRARNISKSYPNREWSLKVDHLEIPRGSLVFIKGTNGSGKSTLLRILGLVDREFEGYLEIDGQRVDGISAADARDLRARNIGFVFQEDRLLPRLSLWENSELPARIQGTPRSKVKEQLKDLQECIFRDIPEPEEVLRQRRQSVSGGQRQRAAVLRALSHEPLLILADEPTASLDPAAKKEVVKVFEDLCRTRKATILVVSHDEVFDGVGITYELSKGRLETGQTSTEPDKDRPAKGSNKHLRASPLGLLGRIAWKETIGNPLFAAMILIAMSAGLSLLTMLWSVLRGTEKVLADVISKGSRLDRISVDAKAGQATAGGLPSEEILEGLGIPIRVARRRDVPLRIETADQREQRAIVFGLESDDPELEKLELLAGELFEDPNSLAVLITQRSIERLIGSGTMPEAAIGRKVKIGFRRYFTEQRPEDKEFEFIVQGVVDHAEHARNYYLPQGTLRAIASWQVDLESTLFESEGRLELDRREDSPKAGWEYIDIYFDRLEDVIPASRYFAEHGFSSRTDLFRNRWVLDTRRFVTATIIGILVVVLTITALLIVSNVISSVRLERKEIALLKLMGMKDRDVASIFMLGVLACTLIGGAGGLAVGSMVIVRLREWILEVYPSSPISEVMVPASPTWWLSTLLICLVVNGTITFFAAQWTARKDMAWNLD